MAEPPVVPVGLDGEPVTADHPAIARAAAVLRAGGLVAFPTETVYGLGAVARSADAVERIFAAKGRPADDPLIVHVRADWPLADVFAEVDGLTRALIARHWPGPLTLVRTKHPSIPDIVTAHGPTVAVRAPAHPVAAALLEAVAAPIAAPSANRFSYVSATTAAHVVDDLGAAVDLVLDGGPATSGIESTVVAVEASRIVVLRHGALPIDELAAGLTPELTAALGTGVEVVEPDPGARMGQSPGRLVRHYSPATIAWACPPDVPPHPDLPGRVAYLACTEDRQPCPADWDVVDLGSTADLVGVAAALFSTLRAVDRQGYDALVLQLTGRSGLGAAIDDRLHRAASGRTLG